MSVEIAYSGLAHLKLGHSLLKLEVDELTIYILCESQEDLLCNKIK